MRYARLLIAIGSIAAAGSLTAPPSRPAPVVHTATVDGIIHPVSSEFMRSVIARADADGAALIVFTLRTPGGLLDSTRDIINAMIAAKTPVAVFVGPVRQPRRLRRVPDHDRRRRRRHVAGDAHRRRASGRRQRREDRRRDGEEDGVRHGGLRADARDAARPQRRAGRTGRHREPILHRAGGVHRHRRRSSTSSPRTSPT